MIRPKPGKPVLDPRLILAEEGAVALKELIATTGYVPQEKPFAAFVKALRTGTPLITEGLGGSGKTAFAEAVAEACNLPFFSLPCMPGMTGEVLLGKFNTEMQHAAIRRAIDQGVAPTKASRTVWTADYYEFGEVLGAYAYMARTGVTTLLLLDEIDKLDAQCQFHLLQLLARGYADIPKLQPDNRLGILTGLPPIVYLTSNNMASGVNGLLRSRSLYAWFDAPKLEETVRILRARVPDAPYPLFVQLVKLAEQYRSESAFVQKPELRDWIRLLAHLAADGIPALNERVLAGCASFLAKTQDDWANYHAKIFRFLGVIEAPDATIETLAAREFGLLEPIREPLRLVSHPETAA